MNIFKNLSNYFIFKIERFLIKGAWFQLFSVAVTIVIISLFFGAIAFFYTDHFMNVQNAIWWAFLRLTDPGYLGDDQGYKLRTLSTILTVLGYVLFMGSLVAIMAQGLNRLMSKLEAGLTPIREKNHIVILGLTRRTPLILRELLVSKDRVLRFLKRFKKADLKIVILSKNINSKVLHELKAEVGPLWDDSKVVLRSGNPLEVEHLDRVDFMRSASIIYPASDLKEDRSYFDANAFKFIQICNTQKKEGKPSPLIVTEMINDDRLKLIPDVSKTKVQAIPLSTTISRLIVQNIKYEFLSFIYNDLLTHGEGNEVYIRSAEELSGKKVGDVRLSFSQAIFIGIIHEHEVILNPDLETIISDDDKCVFIAEKYEQCFHYGLPEIKANSLELIKPLSKTKTLNFKKILIFGWSDKVHNILEELNSLSNKKISVDVASIVSLKDRQKTLQLVNTELKNIELNHLEMDYTSSGFYKKVQLQDYDHFVFVANDWMTSDEQSDARTWLGFLQLTHHKEYTNQPIIVEVMSSESEGLFEHQNTEVINSPILAAHMITHVALRPELNAVFDELFGPEGAEIILEPLSNFTKNQELYFYDLQRMSYDSGLIALGYFDEHTGKSLLNPSKKDAIRVTEHLYVVLLTTASGV